MQPRQGHEFDGGFGVSSTFPDATGNRPQRDDVAGTNEVPWPARGVCEHTEGLGAIVR